MATSDSSSVRRRRRIGATTLSIACCGVAVVSAFSPPPRRAGASPPASIVVQPAAIFKTRTRLATTRLGYKHLNDGDGDDGASKNETAVGMTDAEAFGEVIFYNDLGPEIASGDAGLSSRPTDEDDDDRGLVRELEDVIKSKGGASEESPEARATAPDRAKPAGGFVSPIQMIKKVPKVEPISMSVKLSIDSSKANVAASLGATEDAAPPEAEKPEIENWKTRMDKQGKNSTAFMATSYLQSLGAEAGTKHNDPNEEGEEDNLLKALRDQQASIRHEQLESQKQAMYEATRRTNPKEAIEKRVEEGEKKRKEQERENLERLYVERKERLDAKKRDERRYLEEKERQGRMLEEKAREREKEVEAIVGGEAVDEDAASDRHDDPTIDIEVEEGLLAPSRGGSVGRCLPVFHQQSSAVDAPPLLVGATLTFRCSDLTPTQRRAVEAVRRNHEDHVERTNTNEDSGRSGTKNVKEEEDDPRKGGAVMQAAPVIAIIDSYTAAMRQLSASERYATLARVEYVDRGSAVMLTGVGRAILRDIHPSREHGEGGLSPVVAKFDLHLDDTPILPDSSMRAFSELRQAANGVYRLHEERKKLVEGLRAGEARLRLGRDRAAAVKIDENCLIDFVDCDGLGIFGRTVVKHMADPTQGGTGADETARLPRDSDEPRSRLESLENYGLGAHGLLSTIPDLAKGLASLLRPYREPSDGDRGSGDRDAGMIASFAAFVALEGYATPDDAARALLTTSATRRLEMARIIMERHRGELAALADAMGAELGERGKGGRTGR